MSRCVRNGVTYKRHQFTQFTVKCAQCGAFTHNEERMFHEKAAERHEQKIKKERENAS